MGNIARIHLKFKTTTKVWLFCYCSWYSPCLVKASGSFPTCTQAMKPPAARNDGSRTKVAFPLRLPQVQASPAPQEQPAPSVTPLPGRPIHSEGKTATRVQGEDHGREQKSTQLGLGSETPRVGTDSDSALPVFCPSQHLLCRGEFSSRSQELVVQLTAHG